MEYSPDEIQQILKDRSVKEESERKNGREKKQKALVSFSREKRVALLAGDLGVLTVSVPFSVCVSEIGISLEADCGDERGAGILGRW